MPHLTNAERDTLNAAMDVILAHTPENAVWMPYVSRDKEGSAFIHLTYFTKVRAQYSLLAGETFADRIETAIALQAEEDANSDSIRDARVEALRAELATLTGETA